jgi:hypothetical protein
MRPKRRLTLRRKPHINRFLDKLLQRCLSIHRDLLHAVACWFGNVERHPGNGVEKTQLEAVHRGRDGLRRVDYAALR